MLKPKLQNKLTKVGEKPKEITKNISDNAIKGYAGGLGMKGIREDEYEAISSMPMPRLQNKITNKPNLKQQGKILKSLGKAVDMAQKMKKGKI